MPNAPARPCGRCGRRLVRGRGVCSVCRRKADAMRGTPAERGYDAVWAAYSRDWLSRFPWCGMRADGRLHPEHSRCAAAGLRVRAEVTDHILSMRQGGAQFHPANHQSLCRGCNSVKAILHEGGFGR